LIGIVDYNMGNLASVINAFESIGAKIAVESDPQKLKDYDKLILPGVGAFGDAMEHLKANGMDISIKEYANSGKLLLGICLGMQLMTKSSEEGKCEGLGWVNAKTKKFKFSNENDRLKIPHMGWNYITIKKQHYIFDEMYENPKFYFVHSYYVDCYDGEDILASAKHGIEFTCAFAKENIIGTQFHPEKSHKYGFKIIENFAKR
jgi:glutamine amidotransferase